MPRELKNGVPVHQFRVQSAQRFLPSIGCKSVPGDYRNKGPKAENRGEWFVKDR
jgi:hypothetical protein